MSTEKIEFSIDQIMQKQRIILEENQTIRDQIIGKTNLNTQSIDKLIDFVEWVKNSNYMKVKDDNQIKNPFFERICMQKSDLENCLDEEKGYDMLNREVDLLNGEEIWESD